MTSSQETETPTVTDTQTDDPTEKYLDELPGEVEMSLFDHLEELRQRIFYALIAVVLGAITCFIFVRPIVRLLEVPAGDIKFLQLAPGEFFFVSIKVAGYSGLLISTPFILYQIAQFVLPGLTRRERRLIAPIVLGSSVFICRWFILCLYCTYPCGFKLLHHLRCRCRRTTMVN